MQQTKFVYWNACKVYSTCSLKFKHYQNV